MTATLRAARTDDVDALVRLRALMFREMGLPAAAVDDPPWRAAAARWFTAAVEDPSIHIVVADVSGVVVACAMGEAQDTAPSPWLPSGRVGVLSNVVTDRSHRGERLGSRLTDAVVAWFDDETDVTRVDLFATPDGEQIYARSGFARTPFPAMRRPILRLGCLE